MIQKENFQNADVMNISLDDYNHPILQSKMTQHLDRLIHKYQSYSSIAKQTALQKLPILSTFTHFQLFILLNITLFLLMFTINMLRDADLWSVISPFNIWRKLFRLMRLYIPFVKNRVNSELASVAPTINKSIPEQYRSSIKKLPRKSNVPELGNATEKEAVKGYLSGSRYPGKEHSELISNLSSYFIYSNPLHFDIHPCVRQMEVEVIKMTAKMLNFTEKGEPVGVFMSGGTESIAMAILAYRGLGREKGITKPNLLICETGHPASHKACHYFDIDVKVVKCDKNYEMDFNDMKSKIDNNTIGVYTSFPNYPYGNIDPIHKIAAYCEPRGIPIHLDMCLGGFLVPFLNDPATKKPLLNIPKGITSISADVHKYGLAGKGSSILLYSSAEIRKHQFFVTSCWPGGLYGTVGIAGSRSGVGIASSWISMMKMGQNGFRKSAEAVQKAVMSLSTELKSLGFKIFGNPIVCTIGFLHPDIASGSIHDWMHAKGWDLPLLQKPMSIHFSFTPLNATRVDEMIRDFKLCIKDLKGKAPNNDFKSDTAQLYGACAQIPDGLTQNEIMMEILDSYQDV